MKRKGLLAVFLVIMAMLLMTGCKAEVKADISSYADDKITIVGLAEDEIIITPEQLAQMECVKETVKGTSKGKEIVVSGVGPTLETLLAGYEIPLSSVRQVIFTAGDGYSKSFDSDFFVIHPDIVLSVESEGEPLLEENQPVRLLIPGTTPDNWVKGVIRIQFVF